MESNFEISKAAQVNDKQSQAIHHQGSHLLICAGPGTGKTYTLVHRIVKLAPELKHNQKILAVTFTNKAAQEMQERLIQYKISPSRIFVGTFHSFCLNLIQKYQNRVEGLDKDFKIVSLEEDPSYSEKIWPDKSARERKESIRSISLEKTQYSENISPQAAFYNSELRRMGCVDFDDILWIALHLIKTNKNICDDLIFSYPFIFVDEYQDINPIQHEFLKEIVRPQVFLTAIGDANQSIYGFRGADNRLFHSFINDFPGAEILRLKDNYRSSADLLNASSQVIAKIDENFELTAKIFKKGQLTIHTAATDKAEAEYIVHQIEKLVGGTSLFSKDSKRIDTTDTAGYSFGDIAIFYRLKSQSHLLKEALDRSGMPYFISGKKNDDIFDEIFLSRPENTGEWHTEKISLMTLHASKGLEFPVVFIMGCEENLLPLNFDNWSFNLDEERRLFYVGMTRAKERLFLTNARKRFVFGKCYENPPSRFISDIEDQLKAFDIAETKRLPPKEKQFTLFQ